MRSVANSLAFVLMAGTIVANIALWTAWGAADGQKEFQILLEVFLFAFGLITLVTLQTYIWGNGVMAKIPRWHTKLCFATAANVLLIAPFMVMFFFLV